MGEIERLALGDAVDNVEPDDIAELFEADEMGRTLRAILFPYAIGWKGLLARIRARGKGGRLLLLRQMVLDPAVGVGRALIPVRDAFFPNIVISVVMDAGEGEFICFTSLRTADDTVSAFPQTKASSKQAPAFLLL